MAEAEGTSCQLCLRADEPSAMVPITITHSIVPSAAPVLLCRDCIAAVLDGSRRKMEEEQAADQGDPRPLHDLPPIEVGEPEPVELPSEEPPPPAAHRRTTREKRSE